MWRTLLALCAIEAAVLLAVGCGSGDSTSSSPQHPRAQRQAVRHHAVAMRRHARMIARHHHARMVARQYHRAQVREQHTEEAEVAAAERAAAEEAEALEAAAEEEASECDPNYSGACLSPSASDYDCAGGSGDGPEYTGTVTVVGEDRYGLDADGDGIGCEAG